MEFLTPKKQHSCLFLKASIHIEHPVFFLKDELYTSTYLCKKTEIEICIIKKEDFLFKDPRAFHESKKKTSGKKSTSLMHYIQHWKRHHICILLQNSTTLCTIFTILLTFFKIYYCCHFVPKSHHELALKPGSILVPKVAYDLPKVEIRP